MGLFVDRAAMSVSGTPGTGTITLGSAYYKHQTFAAAGVTNGQLVAYVIEDGASWEVGKGTYSSSGPTLARTTIYFSSNSNAAINASSSSVVSVTLTAEDIGPAGSSGYVQFNNAGAWGSSSNLFWDNTNGRLGIGTAAPAAVLHATLASTASLIVGFNNTSAIYYDANTHYFRSGATGTLGNIDSNGQLNFYSLNAYKGTSPNAAGILTAFGGASSNYYDANLHVFRDGASTERMRIDASGNVLVNSTGGLGYGTGSGGTVTQVTSRTTGVTLNKTNGAITLVSAAGSATYQTFTVTNSAVAATDTVILNQKSGADKYILLVTNVASGSFQITFATTGGTTTEQPVINFAVIKAVTA